MSSIKPYDSFVSKEIWLRKRIICTVGSFSSKVQNSIQLGVAGTLTLVATIEVYFTILRQFIYHELIASMEKGAY